MLQVLVLNHFLKFKEAFFLSRQASTFKIISCQQYRWNENVNVKNSNPILQVCWHLGKPTYFVAPCAAVTILVFKRHGNVKGERMRALRLKIRFCENYDCKDNCKDNFKDQEEGLWRKLM